MAIKQIKRAIRSHLSTLTPSLPTALEAIPFTPPDGMYQRLQFVVHRPTDPTFGTYFYRENVEAQFFVVDKLDKGTTDAEERAELIRDWFYKGLTLNEGTIKIHVLETPHVGSAIVAVDRIVVPVLVTLVAEIYQQ